MTSESSIVIGCSIVGSATSILMSIFMGRVQKNEVKLAFTPASKEEFDRHVERNLFEHEVISAKIVAAEKAARTDLMEVIREGNESREKLHERINELLPRMGELSRNVDLLNDKLP